MPEQIFLKLIRAFAVFALLAVGMVVPIPVTAQGGLHVIVHYVEGITGGSKTETPINVYLSVLDQSGNPISNLEKGNFLVTEDGKKVAIGSFERASRVPLNIILLVDNSESMTGAKIENTLRTAGQFIGQLEAGDRAAVYSFNDEPTLISDFDLSRQDTSGRLGSVVSMPGTGACIYDALFMAVQRAESFPPGRRALLLVTDSTDGKVDGSPCSAHTLDEVANLAKTGSTRVPIYFAGFGDGIDRAALEGLAISTGGHFLNADNENFIENLFANLTKEFKYQYALHYTSSSTAGQHKVAVVVDYAGGKAQNERSFTLQNSDTSLSILTPNQGEEVSGVVKITVAVQGGDQIGQVVFQVNGENAGTTSNVPYVFDWDSQNATAGSQTITLIAMGKDGSELAKSSTTVVVLVPEAQIIPTPISIPTPVPPAAGISKTTLFVGAGVVILGGVLALALIVGIFFILRFRSHSIARKVKGLGQLNESAALEPLRKNQAPSRQALASLDVLFSDDPAMAGRVLEISKPRIMIGRGLDCDFIFPQDTPISRNQVLFELHDGQFVLSEVTSQDADGNIKRPKFGTFVNENQVERALPLNSGDVIRLGPRTRLRFKQYSTTLIPAEETIDLSILANAHNLPTNSVAAEAVGGEPAELAGRPEQFEETIEDLKSSPHSLHVEANPDPEGTLLDASVGHNLDEGVEVSQAASSSFEEEVLHAGLKKSEGKMEDEGEGKTLDDINTPFSAGGMSPENILVSPLYEDDDKKMGEASLAANPDDIEKTLDDIVIPLSLQHPLDNEEGKTMDDIEHPLSLQQPCENGEGKTMDDISSSDFLQPIQDNQKNIEDLDTTDSDQTLDDISPAG